MAGLVSVGCIGTGFLFSFIALMTWGSHTDWAVLESHGAVITTWHGHHDDDDGDTTMGIMIRHWRPIMHPTSADEYRLTALE